MLRTLHGYDEGDLLGVGQYGEPGLGMITLLWESGGEEVRMTVSDDIATCDLLELLDQFIRAMGREPAGDLDYQVDDL